MSLMACGDRRLKAVDLDALNVAFLLNSALAHASHFYHRDRL